jgi:hypothetical protein
VVIFESSQVERSLWQRRAAAELAAILRIHADLPILAWTVGAAGSVLLGRVAAPAATPEARAVFDTWKTALMLRESSSTSTGGTVHLRAEHAATRYRSW